MAHFAKVVSGIVTQVIVAEPEFFDTFVDTSAGEWIQTSYNTRGGIHYLPDSGTPSDDQSKALRYNYACADYHYDYEADAFYAPQPFPSWTLNTTTYLWEPPFPMPDDGKFYTWNEDTQTWDALPASE